MTVDELVTNTYSILPDAIMKGRTAPGMQIIDFKVQNSPGVKTKKIFATIKSQERPVAYTMILEFNGLEDPENTIVDLDTVKFKCRCSCSNFYFMFGYWDKQVGALSGPNQKKYVRKTTTRPEVNPCFIGSTKVRLLDGTSKSMEELVELYKDKEFWVYSSTEKGNIVPGLANSPRITGYTSDLIEVTLDNGGKEVCTPDHLWMLRDGSYRAAKELSTNDSLMPLYTYETEKTKWKDVGYELIKDNESGELYFTHTLAYKDIPKGYVRHHINLNKRDNRPENILVMRSEDHIKLHSELVSALWLDPEFKRICNLYTAMTKSGLKLTDENWDESIRDFVRLNNLDKRSIRSHNIVKKYFSGVNEVSTISADNHKVIGVNKLKLDTDIPVYDFSVEEYHNFALESGVFVHNSHLPGMCKHIVRLLISMRTDKLVKGSSL